MEKFYRLYANKTIDDVNEFKKVAAEFKRNLKKILNENEEIVNLSTNYFYISGFIKKGDKYVYISTYDVRYDPDWCNRILVRTAKNTNDFTGGSNNYVSALEIRNMLNKLL